MTGPYIRKYLAGAPDCDVVDRMKVLRLIENMVAGAGAVGYLIESMHGAGPPVAQVYLVSLNSAMGPVRAIFLIPMGLRRLSSATSFSWVPDASIM